MSYYDCPFPLTRELYKLLKKFIYTEYDYRVPNVRRQNFIRLAPPQYSDGLNEPAGKDLPSARVISNQIFAQGSDGHGNSQGISNLLWLFGQAVDDHSITLTKEGTEKFPIPVPKGDPFFDPNGTGSQVINFTRSAFDPATGVKTPREQFNSLSPFLDASFIYGSDKVRNDYLRSHRNGLMRVSEGNMLPFYDGYLDNAGHSPYGAFIAGDVRSNEHWGLAAFHIIGVRLHNILALLIRWIIKLLLKKHRHSKKYLPLNDSEIYQKARILVEAIFQSITINEFLPTVLGEKLCPYKGYNPHIDPQLSNEFSSAIFRLHVMISNNMYHDKPKLRETFFSSQKLCNRGGIGDILKGFSETRAEEFNHQMIDDLRNFLFGKPGEGGHDLAALNIQRGRDHGLASYNQVREAIGLKKITSLDQLTKNTHLQNVLKELYPTIDDIELFVGAVIEEHYLGIVGPTHHKIIKDQFERIRDGDRFWYEGRLDEGLIKFVESFTLSRVLELTTEVKCFNKNPFKV